MVAVHNETMSSLYNMPVTVNAGNGNGKLNITM